jgi:hypothetical protein
MARSPGFGALNSYIIFRKSTAHIALPIRLQIGIPPSTRPPYLNLRGADRQQCFEGRQTD